MNFQNTFIVSACNLSAILTQDQLDTISKLTLTGTIDARDFKTMRDEMPLLAEIDLSGVNIIEYSGSDGTNPSSWGNTGNYPASTIPNFAFTNPDSNLPNEVLDEISLPTSLSVIGRASFRDCINLSAISIPDGVLSIEMDAFQRCKKLAAIVFPEALTTIGYGAFHECSSLDSVNIPATVTLIEEAVFARSSARIFVNADNINYSSIDGVLFNKNNTVLLQCPVSITGSYIVPSTVLSFQRFAFEMCTGLTRITLPNSVTEIGDDVFNACRGLESINIPSSVTSIG